jgi:hypothetical protein
MAEAGHMEVIGEPDPETGFVECLVYEGFMTKLFRDTLHLSVPYYTLVLRKLKAMDCIRQLRRGGSTTPSKWVLLKQPTIAEFMSKGVTYRSARPGSLQQQIGDLAQRVANLETMVESLITPLEAENADSTPNA